MKILCTGDLHLGRRPTRLPGLLEDRRHAAAAVWIAVVERAVSERVDAVILTGDVVDERNKYLEAYGPLEAGVRRLVGEGIDVFAVAGNHDHDVLPRLLRSAGPERCHLLGAGGHWERYTMERGGGLRLHLDGWSFPSESVRTSPLATYDLAPDPSTPTIGILHADLEQARSRYGPVLLAELRGVPMAAWVLGHLHQPRLIEEAGAPPVLYPGSPQPLDPGETGAHGAWLLEVGPGRFRADFCPLATVRYEALGVDVSGAANREDLEATVAEAARAGAQEIAAEPGRLSWIALRLRIEGRTRFSRDADAWLAARVGELQLPVGGATACVEKLENATRPAIALEDLARGRDVAGFLARLILDLETGGSAASDDPGRDLIRDAERRMASVATATAYLQLRSAATDVPLLEPPSPQAARVLLLRQGLRLLDALLGQKEERT